MQHERKQNQNENKEQTQQNQNERNTGQPSSFHITRLIIKLLFYLTMIAMSYHEMQMIHLYNYQK